MDPEIRFFKEDMVFTFGNRTKTREWILKSIKEESRIPGTLNIIFCSDSFLYELNKTYLGHQTLTDIITFPYAVDPEPVSGDIFISIHRVRENAEIFKQTFEDELNRVIIHGVLHLLGYEDGTKKEKQRMRLKEDYYLAQKKT